MSSQLDLAEFRQDNSKAQESASLDAVANVSRGKQNQDQTAIGIVKSTIHQLGNSRHWIRSALREQETHKWFEEAMLVGEDICLIVSYQIVLNALLSKEGSSSR